MTTVGTEDVVPAVLARRPGVERRLGPGVRTAGRSGDGGMGGPASGDRVGGELARYVFRSEGDAGRSSGMASAWSCGACWLTAHGPARSSARPSSALRCSGSSIRSPCSGPSVVFSRPWRLACA